MAELINGRTPEEIMRRMECWNKYYAGECNDGNRSFELRIQQCAECEIRVPGYRIEDAFRDVCEYAKQLERERDAALKDLKLMADVIPFCETCAFNDSGAFEAPCSSCDIRFGKLNWQWRGAQEVV